MTGGTRLYGTAATLLWLLGCAGLSPSSPSVEVNSIVRAAYQSAVPGERGCQGIVLVVDGAGGFEAASRTMRKTAAESKIPLDVRSFHWTHGYCRVLSDQVHATHVRREGRKLAEMVLSCRQEAPGQPIYLVGHSAGCGVVLIAAEDLPPNTVERIVLLAPAVSSKRDLRGALRSSCQGIDVFISSRDWCWLGLGTTLTGTTDRCWLAAAAGKIGFQPLAAGSEDEALYTKLRQYPWDPGLMWTGHKGGHYGAYQPGFLRAFVLPLLWESE